MAAPKSMLITGCSRGVGLELVRQFVAQPITPDFLFACCRNPDEAQELKAIAAEKPFVKLLKLDVTEYDSYPAVVKQVTGLVGKDGLNLLINNAGIMPSEASLGVEEFTKNMITVYDTNVVAPLMLTKVLLPLLKTASKSSGIDGYCWTRSAVVNVTSLLGSITHAGTHGHYSYMASKAALNMVSKKLSADLAGDKILVVSLHPGWIKTDMGGPDAPLTTPNAVNSIINTISKLDESRNGLFLNTDGTLLPF